MDSTHFLFRQGEVYPFRYAYKPYLYKCGVLGVIFLLPGFTTTSLEINEISSTLSFLLTARVRRLAGEFSNIMKKIIVFCAFCTLLAGCGIAKQQTSDRALMKEARSFAKELKHDGWKVNSSRSLETLLFDHYVALQDKNNRELVANVEGDINVKTINAARQWAMNNAAISYAQEAGTYVRGRIGSEVSGGLKDNPSLDNFYAAYESLVAKEISGELQTSVAIYREAGNGSIEYRIYFIVNEEAASQARIRALQNALLESEAARMNAEEISKFVREGFEI